MKTQIGISKKNTEVAVGFLSGILSNEMTLFVKTRKPHWNVSGESFVELHKLFEDQYKQMEEAIDLVAERTGKLGEKTIGTMQEFSQLSSIKEHPGKHSTSKDLLKELHKEHETVIIRLRGKITVCSEKCKDAGTADFLTYLMEEHETMACEVRRYLN